ncbi:MAG: hypothetical protein QM235_12885 [Pseudomonadota bacterium]|nr:hypothetical protein [Pseudomonadota bacterium]
MVIWTDGKIRTYIDEMYDKPARLCHWWVRHNKHLPQFAGGKLLVVSMTKEKTS